MRSVRVFAVLCGVQGLLALPGLRWPGYLDTPVGLFLVWPYFLPYIAHAIGIPGTIANDGACGWGWCAPTVFGWAIIGACWFAFYWGVAILISKVIEGGKHTSDSP